MHVLQVAPRSGYPPSVDGGAQRMDGLLSARRPGDTVVRWCEIAGLSVEVPDEPIEIDEGYREYRWRSFLQLLTSTLTGRFGSPQVFNYYATTLSKTPRLNELINGADVIMVELPYQFEYVNRNKPPDTPIVYSSHNFEPERLSFLSDGPISSYLYRRVWARERYAVTNADLVVVCSERDGSLYRRHFDPDTRIVTLPNAARLDEVKLNADGPLPDSLDSVPTDAIVCGFVGTNYGPNIEAAEHIVEMSEHPDVVESGVHFLVLGDVGDSFGDVERENVHFTGFVEDLNPLYDRFDLALNPMTDGGGSNVKVPEYFAHGLPVLTTPFGARGFSLGDREFATVAELESFPEVLSYLDRPTLQHHGELARRYAESTLNWKHVSQQLWDELLNLVGEFQHGSTTSCCVE